MPASRRKKFTDSLSHLAALTALIGGCLVVAWEVWPRLDRWHQKHLAQQLADRIATLPDNQVKIPLHQLASLGTPALGPLVEAAASPRAAVARIARQKVDLELSACLVQLEEKVDDHSAETLLALAAGLAENTERFGPAGQRWAEGIALRMIEVSELLPAVSAAELLSTTSRILDAIPPRSQRLTSVETALPEQNAVFVPPPIDLRQLATPSERVLSEPELQEPLAQPLVDAPVVAPDIEEPAPTSDELWSQEWIGIRSIPAPPPLAGDASLSVQVRERQTTVPIDVPTPLDFRRRLSDLRRESTDKLIEQLASADKFLAGAIRTVLTERGIDMAELDLISRAQAADESDRLRLVEEISQLPAAVARRLLRQMLNDPSGEVRLRALTALATTSDPGLATLARKVAIEDQDPRVADLATKLLRQ
jgi:hypothetical protein